MNDLDSLVNAARAAFAVAREPAALENEKARFLGKSGSVTESLKELARLAPEDRKTRGAAINAAKQAIEGLLEARRGELAEAERLSLQHLAAFQASAADAERLQGALAALHQEAARNRQAMDALQAEAAEWRQRWTVLDEAHRAVLSSRSWRWTRPLRWITARLRGDPR